MRFDLGTAVKISPLILVVSSLAAAEPKAPDPGPDDCYNRVSATCNRKHPGKNYGDQVYRDCINDGLSWCDVNEPSSLIPRLDSDGRFTKASQARWWQFWK